MGKGKTGLRISFGRKKERGGEDTPKPGIIKKEKKKEADFECLEICSDRKGSGKRKGPEGRGSSEGKERGNTYKDLQSEGKRVSSK